MDKLNSYQKALLNPYFVAAMVVYFAVIMPGAVIVVVAHPTYIWLMVPALMLPAPLTLGYLYCASRVQTSQQQIPRSVVLYFAVLLLKTVLVGVLFAYFKAPLLAYPLLFAVAAVIFCVLMKMTQGKKG